MIYEPDIAPGLLTGKSFAVVGYGNQGRAHALNLRDRGLTVVVGAREGKGQATAVADGFESLAIPDAVFQSNVIVMTVPDEVMGIVFDGSVQPHLQAGALLVFAHGFAMTYGTVTVPEGSGAVLVSPSGPGTALRESFLDGTGIPGFVAADPKPLLPFALAYGWAIGCAKAGLLETTFREETECDLFGEQTVLCGGMPELAMTAFETLVEAGYQPEVAYTECVQQVRLLADLMARYGVAGMKEKISDTAEWGSYKVGSSIISREARAAMKGALRRIQSGEFAKDWLAESASGKNTLEAYRKAGRARLAEATFKRLQDESSQAK